MFKVVATRYFFDDDVKFLTENFDSDISFIYPSKTCCIDTFLSAQSDVNVFIGPPPARSHLIRNLSSLSLVQIPWSGLDSCDLSSCYELSIPVANSHSNSYPVAEFSLSLALSLLKHIPFHHSSLVSKGLSHRPSSPEGFYPSRLLSEMSVGIWGCGAIGNTLGKLLDVFKCRVLTCGGTILNDNQDNHFNRTEYLQFLSSVDLLFITLPLNHSTRQIFNAHSIAALKKGASVVNISRGEIICERSLIEALKLGLIQNFASDFNSSLAKLCMENKNLAHRILLSPHRAGFVSGQLPHLRDAIYNINQLATSRQLTSVINLISAS